MENLDEISKDYIVLRARKVTVPKGLWSSFIPFHPSSFCASPRSMPLKRALGPATHVVASALMRAMATAEKMRAVRFLFASI